MLAEWFEPDISDMASSVEHAKHVDGFLGVRRRILNIENILRKIARREKRVLFYAVREDDGRYKIMATDGKKQYEPSIIIDFRDGRYVMGFGFYHY